MVTQFNKLMELKSYVESNVPKSAEADAIWNYLGWKDRHQEAFELLLNDDGLDLMKVISPELCDIVSLVDDGVFPLNGTSFSWDAILDGEVTQFCGTCPKERMLAVIDVSLEFCGN